MILSRILITGAAGVIGSAIRPVLAARYPELYLLDRVPITKHDPNEHVIRADIRSVPALEVAMSGVDCVLHLAAIPDEDTWPRIRDANIEGTFGVFEAARRSGVTRVVFASSHHVVGLGKLGKPVAINAAPCPSGLYGVSKLFGEALARLYSDKFGLSVICLRIAAYAPKPHSYRHLLLWISPRDTTELCRCAIEAPEEIRFLTVFGTSNNRRGTYDRSGWDVLGYRPVDDSETFLGKVPHLTDQPAEPGDLFNGVKTSVDGLVEEQ